MEKFYFVVIVAGIGRSEGGKKRNGKGKDEIPAGLSNRYL
jgi:hypothetical protein